MAKKRTKGLLVWEKTDGDFDYSITYTNFRTEA